MKESSLWTIEKEKIQFSFHFRKRGFTQSFPQKHTILKTINTVSNKKVKKESQLRNFATIFLSP